MTLAEVAESADLSLPYVSNLERGRGNPTIDALSAIAKALDLTLSDLIGDGGATEVDPLELLLADLPKSLETFSRSGNFLSVVARLASQHGEDESEMRRRLLVGMASAPRRSSGEPTSDDWRRLLDVYRVILAPE